MPLSWNEIKTRSLAFSKEWQDETSEDASVQPSLFDMVAEDMVILKL